MRVPFDSIFSQVEGRIVPQVHIAIGNVATAAGTPLSPTMMISGIQISSFIDCDLSVEQEEGLIEIGGFYEPGELLVAIKHN
jgi:hypothetical protein